MESKKLNEEQRDAIRDCNSAEDLLDVMKSGVIELEDWQLEHVVGGIDAAFDPRELFGIELP